MPRPTAHFFWRNAELPCVELRRANDSCACYAPHAHAAWSIGAVDGGSTVLQRGGSRQRLVGGDVVIIPAGEVHCCNPEDDGRWSYQMLYLDDAWLRGAVGEASEQAASEPAISGRLADAMAPQLHKRLTRLNALLFSDAPIPDKEAALLLFVGDLFGDAAAATTSSEPTTPSATQSLALRRVQAMLGDRYSETLRLDELADCAGMSRYHLLRTFRAAYGMTPHAWQIDLRIQRARRLLEQGMSFADTALSLGFADQSHFQRAFKQRVAVTPGEYLRCPPAAQQFPSRR